MIATSESLKMHHFLNKLMKRPTLGPIVMDLCELIKIRDQSKFDEIRMKQKKLSDVTDMIHAAHVFHRAVRNKTEIHDQNSVLSLLVGDYLLAQSSVDMASLRHPKTVGLIAKGLEDYTKGEFLKLDLIENQLTVTEFHNGIKKYAEFTCGSLLANACLSAVHLADHTTDHLGSLVYSFGHNTGAAQRLIELINNRSLDNKISSDQLSQCIESYLSKAKEYLSRLPDGRTKPALLGMLEKMQP